MSELSENLYNSNKITLDNIDGKMYYILATYRYGIITYKEDTAQ